MDILKTNAKSIYKAAGIIGIIATVIFCIAAYRAGVFESPEAIKKAVESAGVFGPVLFVVMQIVQVVIPIIPGGLTLLAGVLMFGSVWGFIYNYVGIVIGSMLAFLLVRRLGKPFLKNNFSKQYDKYVGWLNKGKSFERMFIVAILMPVAPDDFLCMMAGLTKMSFKKLTAILILCKPPTILAYSIGLSTIATWLSNAIGG